MNFNIEQKSMQKLICLALIIPTQMIPSVLLLVQKHFCIIWIWLQILDQEGELIGLEDLEDVLRGGLLQKNPNHPIILTVTEAA